MKFLYIGEYPDGKSIEQYGVTFRPGEPVDVSDEAAVRKLKANRFFTVAEAQDAPRKPGRRPRDAAHDDSEV